ncbi:helix-turn-helix transcriptional regulator [Paenibacillus sp. N3.4]|uniref:helix-turn-helix transcriptional regulator n=1 Tax=Paenibacillus sp. N3.4 TaxID=2603222 RepID=UPI0011CBCC8B|nr:helix-turn-helix transcriptional regulator [Paenibacillus sp. N3.4]TXK76721.1 helix-turn-helix transcriptional regulator [Paenibacillus sp. N3.4]
MSNEILINTIKVERAKRNLTQEQLADLVGVTRKTINTVEVGKFIPSTILALKIAKVFGVPVEQLFTIAIASDEGEFRS